MDKIHEETRPMKRKILVTMAYSDDRELDNEFSYLLLIKPVNQGSLSFPKYAAYTIIDSITF